MVSAILNVAFNPGEGPEQREGGASIVIALLAISLIAGLIACYARSNRGLAERVNQGVLQDLTTWCEESKNDKEKALRRIAAERIANVRDTGATRLDLSNLGVGYFPSNPEIWKMPNLRTLNLSRNKLKSVPLAMRELRLELCDTSGNPELPCSVRLAPE